MLFLYLLFFFFFSFGCISAGYLVQLVVCALVGKPLHNWAEVGVV